MPLQALVVPFAILGTFLALATVGVRRLWRFPSAMAFALVWSAVTVLAFVADRSLAEPTRNLHSISAGTRSGVASVIGLTVFLGVVAATFRASRRKPAFVRIACAAGSGVVAYPLALAALLYAACMLDLGCI